MDSPTPEESEYALRLARAILASYHDAAPSALSDEADEKLVDMSLGLATALVASEERERRKDEALRRLAKAVEAYKNKADRHDPATGVITCTSLQAAMYRAAHGAREALDVSGGGK